MSRKPLIAGNWKMNLNHFEAIALVQKIAFSLPDKYFDKVDVTVIPPFTDLRSVQTLVDGDKLRLTYGAQDVSQHDSGAYTGEISGAFLAKLGCTFAVVGHSERRTYHGETDEIVAAKAAADQALTGALARLNVVAEAYPDLKANTNFLDLQRQLAEIENQLAFARQYYNDAVASLNNLTQTVPWMLFTGIAGVTKREFYDAPEANESAPEVKF